MSRKSKEMEVIENKVDYSQQDFSLDTESTINEAYKEVPKKVQPVIEESYRRPMEQKSEKPLVNCLRKEIIIVRHIPKRVSKITNPKHVLFGGMAEGAVKSFVVPRLSSGAFVNVLTDDEKNFLEYAMGLEPNSMSIYRKTNNFWDDSNDFGISRVRLTKDDNRLDLSDPEDYVRYKILLANKHRIAPSLQALQDSPKATYQFVLISQGDESKQAKETMNSTMKSYMEYGKIETDADKLRLIIETIDGRPTSSTTKLEFLQSKINELIQADSKLFLKVIEDKLLDLKVLIRKAVDAGLVSNRGNFLYLRKDNLPLCEDNEEPTLNIAAKYLSNPKHQEVKFYLEAQLNNK